MSKSKVTIDLDQIATPQVQFSKMAQWQLANILSNDPQVAGKSLRISIDGKGCDGFTYAVGFALANDQDIKVEVSILSYESLPVNLMVVLDPFAAYYLQNVAIDFRHDLELDTDGFTVENLDQKQFHGKFWRKNKTLIPPESLKINMEESGLGDIN